MATLTVGDLTPRAQYTASSGQTVFTYGFPIFNDSDLKVYIGSTLQTITTNYTVSGAGTTSGGNVTLTSGATSGDIVTIYRDLPVSRTTDYATGGALLAENLNDDLDKLTMMIQQVEYDLNNRVLRFGQFTTGIPLSEFTESDTDRAGKVLSFDSSGDPNITQELGVWKGNWAASTGYVLRDLVKDSSNSNVYICTTAHTSSGSTPVSSNTDVGKWALLIDAVTAASSSSAAAASATAAASSASAAATSATAAAASKTAAETAETNAETAETNAETAETNAATSKTAAASSASSASTSASTATTQANNASTSATSASGSATTATTKAGEASTSASSASTSASTATAQASAASGSATSAASSATSANTAKTAAETAKTAAETAQAAAEAVADNIDDVYLGAKASDPSVDNDGDALNSGDWYFNTSSNLSRIYDGSSFNDVATSTTAFLPKAGGTMTGDLSLGDAVKATFGASDDLQIYHDGSNSYIKDGGTGALTIDATDFYVKNGLNTKTYIQALDGGAVSLRYNDATRFATTNTGIDITGSVTCDGATIAGDINATGDIYVTGTLDVNSTDSINMHLDSNNDSTNSFSILDGADNNLLIVKESGNVGIGTSSPSSQLHLSKAGGTLIKLGTSKNTSEIEAREVGSGNSLVLSASNSTDHLVITGSGNVGIGTDSPNAQLDIEDSTQAVLRLNHPGTNYWELQNDSNLKFNRGGTERMRIDSSGNVGIGTSSPSAKLDVTGRAVVDSANCVTVVDNDGSFDMDGGNNFKCTPSGNFTLTFTNITDGQSGFILLVNSGGHTVSAASTSKVDANLLATVSTAGTYLISYFSDGTSAYLTNSAVYA